MSLPAQAHMLPDGRRLHLHHGPIDLVIEASGPDVTGCYRTATQRFQTILSGLAAELSVLRRPVTDETRVSDPVAQRMVNAVQPYRGIFVTPMAAVAGAVADEVLAAILAGHKAEKVHVNNGGDVAFYLAAGQTVTAQGPTGPLQIASQDPVRGLATSGWRGRSHSLGIADAVTVAGPNAASADVAATLIANAVDLPGHPAITRTSARDLSPDSDLGDRLVTTNVGTLQQTDIDTALARGSAVARDLCQVNLIHQAVLTLCGHASHVSQSQGTLIHA